MPYTNDQLAIPFSGRTLQSRQNSYRAALAQMPVRGVKKRRMLNYIRQHGRVTDAGLAEGLCLPIQSVCSLRNALVSEGKVVQVDTAIGRYGRHVSVYTTTEQAQPLQEQA